MNIDTPVFRRTWLAPALLVMSILLSASGGMAAPVRMAVMGDSLSNVSQVPGGAPNWISQLNSSFPGSFTFQNKAVGGAPSWQILASQLPPVLNLASNHQIDLATTIIAGNDVTYMLLDLSNGVSVDPAAVVATYVANVKTALDSIQAANPNVKQVFGSMLDFTVAPLLNTLPPDWASMVIDVTVQANAQANAYALSKGIPVLDLYSLSHVLPQVTPATPFALGGVNFTNAYVSDNFHPQPWVQGLIANAISTAYNVQYGLNLPILSDQKIVQNAGRTPRGPISYYDVTPFIVFPVPEPSTWLIACSGAVLVCLGRVRAKQRRRAA